MSNLLIQSREKVVRSFQQVEAQVQSLPQGSEQRIAIERQIADNRSQAALSIEQFKQDKLQAERDGAYKGVSANDAVGEGIKTTAEKQVETIARKAGLDPVKTLQRYNGTRAVHQKQADEWRDQEIKEAGDAGFTADDVDNAHKNIKSVYNEARENLRSHEDNKRQIVRSAENQDAQEQNNQTREDLAEDRFNRVRAVITPEQRQRLERGDASQLSSVSNDPNTQRIIARDYLNAAIERADPVQQNQLAQSRNAIETQLREQAAEQQRQSAQRQGRGDDGISR